MLLERGNRFFLADGQYQHVLVVNVMPFGRDSDLIFLGVRLQFNASNSKSICLDQMIVVFAIPNANIGFFDTANFHQLVSTSNSKFF